jgi:hypothetical protein
MRVVTNRITHLTASVLVAMVETIKCAGTFAFNLSFHVYDALMEHDALSVSFVKKRKKRHRPPAPLFLRGSNFVVLTPRPPN